MAETLVEKHMRLLGISEAEAIALIESDKKVDKMSQKELTSDLTDEQRKNVKKATQTGTRKTPTVYKFDTTEKKRKENPTKSSIIAEIAKFLEENSENACEMVTITNTERQIAFKIGENDYELTLVQKRKPKK